MTISAMRVKFERNVAEGRMRRGMGRGRGRRADHVLEVYEPKQHHMEEEEVGNADDDEQSHVEVESQQLDGYPSGPNDVYVLTQYHLHVTYRMSEGVVRFIYFKFFVLCLFM